nr:MAG TPA: hypothetical protein [Caudoviricetes sp.]
MTYQYQMVKSMLVVRAYLTRELSLREKELSHITTKLERLRIRFYLVCIEQ